MSRGLRVLRANESSNFGFGKRFPDCSQLEPADARPNHSLPAPIRLMSSSPGNPSEYSTPL
jgi:hypothetical protein